MTQRIRDALKILRGQAKAVPVEANWYVLSSWSVPVGQITPSTLRFNGQFRNSTTV